MDIDYVGFYCSTKDDKSLWNKSMPTSGLELRGFEILGVRPNAKNMALFAGTNSPFGMSTRRLQNVEIKGK